MESIMTFIEHYWGVTIAGTLTVGSLVGFIVSAFKTFSSLKKTNASRDAELANAQTRLVNAEAALVAATTTITQLRNDAIMRENEQRIQQQIQNESITGIFKAISYLTMASKLPNDEKLALTGEFTRIQGRMQELAQRPIQVLHTVPVVEPKPIIETVATVIEGAKTLLEKYAERG